MKSCKKELTVMLIDPLHQPNHLSLEYGFIVHINITRRKSTQFRNELFLSHKAFPASPTWVIQCHQCINLKSVLLGKTITYKVTHSRIQHFNNVQCYAVKARSNQASGPWRWKNLISKKLVWISLPFIIEIWLWEYNPKFSLLRSMKTSVINNDDWIACHFPKE